jgi:hypothetical protein
MPSCRADESTNTCDSRMQEGTAWSKEEGTSGFTWEAATYPQRDGIQGVRGVQGEHAAERVLVSRHRRHRPDGQFLVVHVVRLPEVVAVAGPHRFAQAFEGLGFGPGRVLELQPFCLARGGVLRGVAHGQAHGAFRQQHLVVRDEQLRRLDAHRLRELALADGLRVAKRGGTWMESTCRGVWA